jgi:hypothetical protein
MERSLALWCTNVIPLLKTLRQEDREFKTSLDYIARRGRKEGTEGGREAGREGGNNFRALIVHVSKKKLCQPRVTASEKTLREHSPAKRGKMKTFRHKNCK